MRRALRGASGGLEPREIDDLATPPRVGRRVWQGPMREPPINAARANQSAGRLAASIAGQIQPGGKARNGPTAVDPAGPENSVSKTKTDDEQNRLHI